MSGRFWTREEELELVALRAAGHDLDQIAEKLDRSYNSVRLKAQSLGHKQPPPPKPVPEEEPIDGVAFRKYLKRAGAQQIVDVCNELQIIPAQVAALVDECQAEGYEIGIKDGIVCWSKTESLEPVPNLDPLGETEIVLGIVSDTHGGAKQSQITALNLFCEDCRKAGVEHILHAGDAHDGVGVYRGQEQEQYALTAEAQAESNAVNWPAGFTWHVLGGNHDHSTVRKGGINPLKFLAQLRPDVIPYPFDQADVPILPGVDLRLWHPGGGVAYAKSYRLQKFTAEMAFGELSGVAMASKERPTIRFIVQGHFHQMMVLPFGPAIWSCMPGAFAGENGLTKRMGVTPVVGGLILRAWLDRDGRLTGFIPDFRIYPEIEDDWQNYRYSLPETEPVLPLFKQKVKG